ncbi:MAG: MOSC domain-containing protein [Pontibacterium sp.]
MSDINLSAIHVYPLKSTAGIELNRSFVETSGLSFDRRFILSDTAGDFISARKYPQMLHFRTALLPDGLYIVAPDGDSIRVSIPEFFQNYRQVNVWGTEVNGQCCGIEFDEWFSTKLGVPCQLLYFGDQSERGTPRFPDKPVAFADGYPLLLISEASLDDLNQRAGKQFDMRQFRPNIVISGCTPYAEDDWRAIKIGEVIFDVVKPCTRCVMTTYHPDTLERFANTEPLKTLATYRRNSNNEVDFGQNIIPRNEGLIQLDDVVELIE